MRVPVVPRSKFQPAWCACAAGLLSLLLAFGASAEGEQSKIDANASRRQLAVASAMIVGRQPARAVTEVLDPLIAQYEAAYRQSRDLIYSASDPAQSLHYLLEAASHKSNATVVESAWADANYLKGFALLNLGQMDKARQALNRAIALSPDNGGYWNELAYTYQLEKDHVKAIELYRYAESGAQLQMNPAQKSSQLRRAWRGQAYSLVELGRLPQAEALYRRCLELEPTDAVAQRELTYVTNLRSSGDPGNSARAGSGP